MSILSSVLPLLTFGLGLVSLGNVRPRWGWDRSFLRTAAFIGSYTVLGTELLSLIRGVTRLGLGLLWLIPISLLTAHVLRRARQGGWEFPPRNGWPIGPSGRSRRVRKPQEIAQGILFLADHARSSFITG